MIIANDNSLYEVREGISHGESCWYVARVGTKRKEGNQERLSVFFDTPERAQRCIDVLRADDRRLR